MKKALLVFALLGTTILNAQIEKIIGEFTELKVFDLIEVELIRSDVNKVVISGKNTEDVVVVNKNGKLKIKMTLEETFDGDETTVVLYYTTIDIIDANEGSSISSNENIKQFEIDLRAQEGGKINVDLDVNYLNIKAISGGYINTKGKAKIQNISINSGGIYKGKNLISENTKITISAAGEAYINAIEEVDVKVRAGGSVYIYGNPTTIIENKVLGGKIEKMN